MKTPANFFLTAHTELCKQIKRWDGQTAAGTPAASGYYFANCTLKGKVYSLKLWLDR